jgi:predicted RNase H-like HicB family nuclease
VTRTYLIVLERGKESWGAWAPDVPGTGGLGDTVEEARRSLSEGIGYVLEYAIEDDQPFPEAKSTGVDFADLAPHTDESQYIIEWLTVELPSRTTKAASLEAEAA